MRFLLWHLFGVHGLHCNFSESLAGITPSRRVQPILSQLGKGLDHWDAKRSPQISMKT